MRRTLFSLIGQLYRKSPVHRPFLPHRNQHSSAVMAEPVNKTAHPFDKTRFEAVLGRRFFYAPAFEIYGGMLKLIVHRL